MPEGTVVTATNPTGAEAAKVDESLLSKADQPVVSEGESVLDASGAEEKAAREAEEKRLMDAKDETLSAEDKAKKAELVKSRADADAKAAAEARAKGAPEKYEIKPPEGFTLDEQLLAEVTPIFKKRGFDNETAQELTNLYATLETKRVAREAATFKEWNEQNAKVTMAELGANAKVELAAVAKVRSMFSAETIEALNATGIGNLAHFIKDMAKIGKMFSPERLVDDKKSAAGSSNAADILYPTMAKQ